MKIIIGASGKTQSGWMSTEQSQLDITIGNNFYSLLDGKDGLEAIVAEHVLEHLECDKLKTALENCYSYLDFGGYLRIAVPDGFHPDPNYIDYVRPMGHGAGAEGHKNLFNYQLLSKLLIEVGFRVELLEWWDESGNFHGLPWNEADGYIERCLANDPRNKDGKPHYTSLIIDAFKDNDVGSGLSKAYEFISKYDMYKLSWYNRKKVLSFYRIARSAPAGGVVIEMGSHYGFGTVPIWYGAQDGNKGHVIAIDSYTERKGWIGEPYGPEDEAIWRSNMDLAGINPELVKGECKETGKNWKRPVAMILFDLGNKVDLVDGVIIWARHVIRGGIIAIRDIDDFSNGTFDAIRALESTGRWGNRKDWPAFNTSIEKL